MPEIAFAGREPSVVRVPRAWYVVIMTNPNRPKPEARVHVSFRIATTGDAAIAEYARKTGLSWSEAARRILAAGLRELNRKDQVK